MSDAHSPTDQRPNAARIYDFLLGGHHNFEIDRAVGQQIVQTLPFLPMVARIQRWALQDLSLELSERLGHDILVDFASGLPTEENIHTAVKPGTTVIYSDRDPITVEYARDILKGTENVYYFTGEAGRPQELLDNPEVQKLLGGRRDIGMVFWGITAFLSDEAIQYAMQYLYEWAGPKACIAFLAQAAIDVVDEQALKNQQLYARTNTPIYYRSLARFKELVHPWHADERGWIPLLDWHGIQLDQLGEGEREIERYRDAGNGIIGAYLVK